MADPDLTLLDDGDLNWGAPLRSVLLDISRRADGRLSAVVNTFVTLNLNASHAGMTVYRNTSSANSTVVPPNVFQPEDRVLIRQQGAGASSISAGSGMTLISVGKTAPFTLAGVGAIAEIVFQSTTVAYVDGQLA